MIPNNAIKIRLDARFFNKISVYKPTEKKEYVKK